MLKITNVYIKYLKSIKKHNNTYYKFIVNCKFKCAERVNGYIKDPKQKIVGKIYNSEIFKVEILSKNLGCYKLVIINAKNKKDYKKIKFNVIFSDSCENSDYSTEQSQSSSKCSSQSSSKCSSQSSSKCSSHIKKIKKLKHKLKKEQCKNKKLEEELQTLLDKLENCSESHNSSSSECHEISQSNSCCNCSDSQSNSHMCSCFNICSNNYFLKPNKIQK